MAILLVLGKAVAAMLVDVPSAWKEPPIAAAVEGPCCIGIRILPASLLFGQQSTFAVLRGCEGWP